MNKRRYQSGRSKIRSVEIKIRMTPETKEAFKVFCNGKGTTMSEYVSLVVEDALRWEE